MKALRKNTIRFISVLFCLLIILSLIPFSASAEALPDTEGAAAVILYSLTGDRILISKNPDTSLYPAATVKIMSGLLLCEALEGRQEEKVLINSEMLRASSGRKFGLSVGDSLTVGDLLKIAVCGSFNDAYTALAVFSDGSVEDFISRMNQRAAALGATSTHFRNVSGIDDEKMQTTARDMLKISLAASQNQLFMSLSSTFSYPITLNGGRVKTVENRNELHNIYGEYFNINAHGLCSGMTDMGGHCLITKGKFGDAEYICIIMGAYENREYELAGSLLDWASQSFSVLKLREKGEVVGSLPVTLSDSATEIPLALAEDIEILLDRNAAADDARSFDLVLSEDSLKAPVEEGTTVGYMVIRSGNDILACVPVVTAVGTQKNAFLGFMEDIKSFIGGRVALSSLIFAVSALLLFFLICLILSKKKRRRPVYAKGKYR